MYKQGIWIIFVNGEEQERFYTEERAIEIYERMIENNTSPLTNSPDWSEIELVRVLRTTKINEEPVDTIGNYRIYPSIEGK